MSEGALRVAVIHRLDATDRIPLIYDLQASLGRPVEVFFASDGSQFLENNGIAKKHPRDGSPVSQGNLGCTHSHLLLLRSSLKSEEGSLAIFEDDCVFTAASVEIQGFLAAADKEPWDILLFGATEYVEAADLSGQGGLVSVKRFWGTHALIVRKKAVYALIQAFMAFQADGQFPPADWLYSRAIRDNSLVCIGPKDPKSLCRQKEGLRSLVTGLVR
jgi:GR25 family glycosyltransferase involved in LPS biosynthesis